MCTCKHINTQKNEKKHKDQNTKTITSLAALYECENWSPTQTEDHRDRYAGKKGAE